MEVTDKDVARLYLAKVESSSARGIPFELTLTSIKNIMRAKKCYYTGVEFTRNGENSRSIDRIDNTKGYVKGNVCACTKRVNSLKSNLTPAEIQAIARKVK